MNRRYPLEILELLAEVRQLVRDAVPDVRETVYSKGRGLGFRVPRSGTPFAVYLHAHKIEFAFTWGVYLPDPDRILQGEGITKQYRWVNLFPGKPIPHDAIVRLMFASMAG